MPWHHINRGQRRRRAPTSRSAGAGRRWRADTCSLSCRMSDRPGCMQFGCRSSSRKAGGRHWGSAPAGAWTRQVARRSSVVLGSVAVQTRRAVPALTAERQAARERREAPALAPMARRRAPGSAETRTALRSRRHTQMPQGWSELSEWRSFDHEDSVFRIKLHDRHRVP